MQHLMLEALARLVEDPPDATEAAHLEGCAACRAELEGMRRDAAALARLGPIEPDEGAWTALAERLRRERLMGPAAGRRISGGTLLKLAAALALYAGGTATGMAMRARPARVAEAPTARPTAVASPQTIAGVPVVPESPATSNRDLARNVADVAPTAPSSTRGVAEAATPEEAVRAVETAERAYLRAYARYAELTSAQQAEDPVARVAALESIVLTTRQALDRAPADPVINGYHLTAVAQRDAALRQIALRSDGRWF